MRARRRATRGVWRACRSWRRVAPDAGGEGDLPAQQVQSGALEVVQCPGLGGRPAARAATSNAPACRLACAAARQSVRTLRAGSTVSDHRALQERGGRGASPPRAWARPADRSSSEATSSSGPAPPAARCQARRSGSASRIGRRRQREVHRWRSCCRRGRGSTAERTSGCRKCTRAPISSSCSVSAGAARLAFDPERLARRATEAWRRRSGRRPPAASAAGSRRATRRRAAGSAPRCDRTGLAPSGSAKPPASSAAVMPRGSSSNASGLPRVSAMIRSRTRSSSRPGTTVASNARASWSGRPSELQLRQAHERADRQLGWRTANSIITESASRRRATNPRTWPEAPSSHCASSTRQSSGRSAAASASRPRAARATRNRSGGSPDERPNATPMACRWGSGRTPSRSSIGAQS